MLLAQTRVPTATKVITMILRIFRRAKPNPPNYLGTLTKKKDIFLLWVWVWLEGYRFKATNRQIPSVDDAHNSPILDADRGIVLTTATGLEKEEKFQFRGADKLLSALYRLNKTFCQKKITVQAIALKQF